MNIFNQQVGSHNIVFRFIDRQDGAIITDPHVSIRDHMIEIRCKPFDKIKLTYIRQFHFMISLY
ncbi:hypothetical protein ES705_50275 [subsurface metagenome]